MSLAKNHLIVFACLASLGVPAYALDLMQAYDAALSNDPTFRSAVKENEAGQANRVIGRAQLMPRLSANYTWNESDSNVSGAGATGQPNVNIQSKAYASTNAGVQFTQPLLNLQALAMYRQSMAQADQSQAKFLYQTQDLLVRVLQAYTDLLYAQDNLSFLRAQMVAYQEQIAVNTRTFEKGEGTITDKLESISAYELSKAQVIEAENEVENTKRKLEGLIGQQISSASLVKKLHSNFRPVELKPASFEIWRDNALGSNPELLSLQHSVESARQEYLKNKAAHMPVVAMIAGWNIQQSALVQAIGQNSNTTSVGVQVNLPIFSGGEITGRTTQASANYERAQADLDVAKERVITELRKQYDAVRSGQQRVEALNRAVFSATELTRAMRNSVRGGVRINLDILLADKTLATAQRDLAQSKYNLMLANLKMKQLAGNLTLEDLEKTALNFARDGQR